MHSSRLFVWAHLNISPRHALLVTSLASAEVVLGPRPPDGLKATGRNHEPRVPKKLNKATRPMAVMATSVLVLAKGSHVVFSNACFLQHFHELA